MKARMSRPSSAGRREAVTIISSTSSRISPLSISLTQGMRIPSCQISFAFGDQLAKSMPPTSVSCASTPAQAMIVSPAKIGATICTSF